MCILLTCIMLGLVVGGQSSTNTNTQNISGEAWVQQIESNYKAGKYASFLEEMDKWYQGGQKMGRWKPLLQSEEEISQKYHTAEGKKLFDELLTKSKQYNNALTQLKQERNQQLLQISKQNPGSPISLIINDRLHHELTPDQLRSFETFQEWLSPFPLHEPTPLLTQLKQINFETTVKELLLSSAYNQGATRSTEIPYFGKLDENLLDEYQVVLTFDKLNKMQNLTKSSRENDIKQVVSLVAAAFPTIAAQIYEGKSLDRAVKNPTTREERDVAQIMKTYNEKRNELLSKYGLRK